MLEKQEHPRMHELSNMALVPARAFKALCKRHLAAQQAREPPATATSADHGCLGLRATDGPCAAACAQTSCAELHDRFRMVAGRDCRGCSNRCVCSPAAPAYAAESLDLCELEVLDALRRLQELLADTGQCHPALAPGDGVFLKDEVLHRTQDFGLQRVAISFDII